jgi:hypothetical protein
MMEEFYMYNLCYNEIKKQCDFLRFIECLQSSVCFLNLSAVLSAMTLALNFNTSVQKYGGSKYQCSRL